jgi:small-conductance mechanosensitive channel
VKTDLLASLVFGTALLLLGGFLIRLHFTAWRRHQNDAGLEERERRHYRAQFRRRLQVSVLILVLGVILPVGDILMTTGRVSPFAATLWIMGMLLVALWIMLLAGLDWLSTRVHRRAVLGALAGLARKRRELEDEVARLRHEHRNGRG